MSFDKESENLLWSKMDQSEKIEFIYTKQVTIRELLNNHSKVIKQIIEFKNKANASISYCKNAISGLKFKLENKKTDTSFADIFKG